MKLRIVRFGALIHLPTAVGLGLSGAFPLCMRSQVLSLSFGLAISLASVSAFVFNDLKDVNVDRLNKPYRPSVRGEWSRLCFSSWCSCRNACFVANVDYVVHGFDLLFGRGNRLQSTFGGGGYVKDVGCRFALYQPIRVRDSRSN